MMQKFNLITTATTTTITTTTTTTTIFSSDTSTALTDNDWSDCHISSKGWIKSKLCEGCNETQPCGTYLGQPLIF